MEYPKRRKNLKTPEGKRAYCPTVALVHRFLHPAHVNDPGVTQRHCGITPLLKYRRIKCPDAFLFC